MRYCGSRLIARVVAMIALLPLVSQLSLAYHTYATIHGVVTDETGAIVPGTQITATNIKAGFRSRTTSQDSGWYEFPRLPVGTYTLRAAKQGFRTFKSPVLTLQVNQNYDLSVTMRVGSTDESVELIEDFGPQVETTSMQQQTSIGSRMFLDLPLGH